MNNFKKILCLLMSLVMLVGCFMIPTSALADGKDIGLILVADKETAKAGETITYTLYMDADPSVTYTTMAFWVSYNNNVFDTPTKTTLNRTFLGDFGNYFDDGGTVSFPNAKAYKNGVGKVLSTEEAAIYNNAFQIQCVVSSDKGTMADGFTITDKETAQMSFQLTVKADVADGTALPVAILAAPFGMSRGPSSISIANGTSTPAAASVDTIDLSTAAVSSKVGSAVAASILKPLKGQMRYANENKTAFDVRALAYISGEDFLATFGDKAAAEAKITEAGFVFAAGSNVPAPEMSVVEDIVKNYTDGNGKDGYLKKEIHTISTSIKSGDYVLSCMIPDITKKADYNNSLIAVAYIVYTDAEGATQYIYYDAAQTIEFKPLFDMAK